MARVDVGAPNLEALTADAAALETIFGIKDRTVRKFAQDCEEKGVDVRAGRGRYLLAAFLRAYIADMQAKADAREADEVAQAIDAARARKYQAEAKLAELALAKEQGDTVPLQEVRLTWRKGLGQIRQQLLAVPGRYATRTVGLSSYPESQRVWDAAIRDILAELREGPVGSAKEAV